MTQSFNGTMTIRNEEQSGCHRNWLVRGKMNKVGENDHYLHSPQDKRRLPSKLKTPFRFAPRGPFCPTLLYTLVSRSRFFGWMATKRVPGRDRKSNNAFTINLILGLGLSLSLLIGRRIGWNRLDEIVSPIGTKLIRPDLREKKKEKSLIHEEQKWLTKQKERLGRWEKNQMRRHAME